MLSRAALISACCCLTAFSRSAIEASFWTMRRSYSSRVATREEYERRIVQKDASIAERENAVKQQQAEIRAARESINAQIEERISKERSLIAVEEGRKARAALGLDLLERDR